MRGKTGSNRVLDLVRLVVVPSRRVTAEEYVGHLGLNGVSRRVEGIGSAEVVDREGRRRRVVGAVVCVVAKRDAALAEKIAKLCGITVVAVDRRSGNH